jgi:hypothetical protein
MFWQITTHAEDVFANKIGIYFGCDQLNCLEGNHATC